MFEAFRLKDSIGRDMSMDLDDALATKKALQALGHFRIPSYGLTEYPDQAMIDGLMSFQRAHGLRVDGVMRPGGPTVQKINAALRANADEADGKNLVKSGERLRLAMTRRPGAPQQILEGGGYHGPTRSWGNATTGLLGLGALLEMQRRMSDHDTEVAPALDPTAPRPRTQITDPLPPAPPSRPPSDHDLPPNKTTLPRPRPDDLGPPTEIFPEPEERWEYIESFPDQSDLLLDYLIQENSRGDKETQADNDFIVKEMGACLDTMGLRWSHTHGAHDKSGRKRKERYIRPTAGIGAARPDISIKIGEEQDKLWYEDFQTVTTWKDGETLVARERRAMKKIIDLKAAHKERGAVKAFPKSRGKNRPQWEKEMRKAVWEYCKARYRPIADMMKGRGPAGTSR